MVYEPAEDSYLIEKSVRKYVRKGARYLDMGTGSGIFSRVASELGCDVVAVDIDPTVGESFDVSGVKFVLSDLFEKVDGKFDLISFNPPYLPTDDREDSQTALATTGGKKGWEITEKFLESVGDYLMPDGTVLLLISSLTGKEKVESILLGKMFDFEIVDSLKISFEELFVYKIVKSSLLQELEEKGVSGLSLLTSGHRGLIYTGLLDGSKVAVKVQRQDIDAFATVDNEARILERVNVSGIGPKLLFSGKDYFVYKFFEGEFVYDWLERENASGADVVELLKGVYEQMFVLDSLGLNKEEMHNPYKHIIVGSKGFVLLDFERCKPKEKRHNVTQFTQFVTCGRMQKHLEALDISLDKDKMIDLAQQYVVDYSRENFEKLLGELS